MRLSRLAGLTKEMKCQKQITKNGRGGFKDEPVTTITRFDSKSKTHIEVKCPDIVKQYNKSMRESI